MLNVHIWFLISVACQWKWQITSSPKSAQQRTKKHPPHSPLQTSLIVLSVLRGDPSNVKNYRLQHGCPHLSTTQTGEKRLMCKLSRCINNNSNRWWHNKFRMQIDRMRICKLNERQGNMLLPQHNLRLRRNSNNYSNSSRPQLNRPSHSQSWSLRRGLRRTNRLWRPQDKLPLQLLQHSELQPNKQLQPQDTPPSNNPLHHPGKEIPIDLSPPNNHNLPVQTRHRGLVRLINLTVLPVLKVWILSPVHHLLFPVKILETREIECLPLRSREPIQVPPSPLVPQMYSCQWSNNPSPQSSNVKNYSNNNSNNNKLSFLSLNLCHRRQWYVNVLVWRILISLLCWGRGISAR